MNISYILSQGYVDLLIAGNNFSPLKTYRRVASPTHPTTVISQVVSAYDFVYNRSKVVIKALS